MRHTATAALITVTSSLAAASPAAAQSAEVGFACIGVSAIFCLFVWAAPIGIAVLRGHPDGIAITVVTVFLGWTVVGWVVALAWACKSIPRDRYDD